MNVLLVLVLCVGILVAEIKCVSRYRLLILKSSFVDVF